jgi:hypothetical protein
MAATPDRLASSTAIETPEPRPAKGVKQFLRRLTTRLEAATERQREKLAKERIEGDMALERSGMKLLTIEYDIAVEKAERFTRIKKSFAARAQRLYKRGGFFNSIFGWANRTLASFFGWRARSAARTRDYYLDGLTGN